MKKYPEEGSHFLNYVDHVLTMHAQKVPRVWLEYDYSLSRERTGAPWNVFTYPIYAIVKAKCKVRAAKTVVSQSVRSVMPLTREMGMPLYTRMCTLQK